MLNSKIVKTVAAVGIGCVSFSVLALGDLKPSVQVEKRISKKSADTQTSINRLAEQTVELAADYKDAIVRIDQFKAYNRRLELSIAEQEKEMASIEAQMNTIDDTERGLLPLMEEMVTRLEQFVALDVPFREEERKERVAGLRSLLLRADVSTSEKYRQILEAYKTEIKYGNSAEVYSGVRDINGVATEVDYLVFGRVSLVYATRGANPTAALYHNRDGNWIELAGNDVNVVLKAIKDVQRKSKKLIQVPVISAETAQ